MGKRVKNTIQINRRISKESKELLEKLEKEGLSLDFIIKDYARLYKYEKVLWKKVDKKLTIILKVLENKGLVVVNESSEHKETLLSKIIKLFKK